MGAEFAGFLYGWKQMLRDFPGWKKIMRNSEEALCRNNAAISAAPAAERNLSDTDGCLLLTSWTAFVVIYMMCFMIVF